MFWASSRGHAIAGNILVFGYCFCYCLTTLMIRRLLIAGMKTPTRIIAWTWTVLLFLVATGMLFPFAIQSLSVALDGPNMSDFRIGYLPSCYKPNEQWQHFYFLGFYVGIIGLYHLPWLFGRFLQFKPLENPVPGAMNSADVEAGTAS